MTSSTPLQRFTSRCVIVTGGGSGFGEAMCQAFAADGAAVVVAGRHGDAIERVARSLPQAIAVTVDVTDEDQNAAMGAPAVSTFGSIDVLCRNAGGAHPPMPLVDISVEQFDQMFALNTRSVFPAAKHCAPHMPDGGAIVSTASIGARRPRPNLTAYNASKGAVLTLTRGSATELAPRIRVNSVCPVSSPTGFERAALGTELPEEAAQAVAAGIPMADGQPSTTSPTPCCSWPQPRHRC